MIHNVLIQQLCFSGILGQIPDNLQYAYTYLISELECKATWGSQVTARMQCANDDTNSACNVSNRFFEKIIFIL